MEAFHITRKKGVEGNVRARKMTATIFSDITESLSII